MHAKRAGARLQRAHRDLPGTRRRRAAGGHAEVEQLAERAAGDGLTVGLVQVRVVDGRADRRHPGRGTDPGQRLYLPQGGGGEAGSGEHVVGRHACSPPGWRWRAAIEVSAK